MDVIRPRIGVPTSSQHLSRGLSRREMSMTCVQVGITSGALCNPICRKGLLCLYLNDKSLCHCTSRKCRRSLTYSIGIRAEKRLSSHELVTGYRTSQFLEADTRCRLQTSDWIPLGKLSKPLHIRIAYSEGRNESLVDLRASRVVSQTSIEESIESKVGEDDVFKAHVTWCSEDLVSSLLKTMSIQEVNECIDLGPKHLPSVHIDDGELDGVKYINQRTNFIVSEEAYQENDLDIFKGVESQFKSIDAEEHFGSRVSGFSEDQSDDWCGYWVGPGLDDGWGYVTGFIVDVPPALNT